MGGISVGGAHGGKKSVDSEIPLIPFIDLLLCCVMFLLVTAVWNRLASLPANQQVPSPNAPDVQQEPTISLYLQVTHEGYALASTAGDRVEIPMNAGVYDQE